LESLIDEGAGSSSITEMSLQRSALGNVAHGQPTNQVAEPKSDFDLAEFFDEDDEDN